MEVVKTLVRLLVDECWNSVLSMALEISMTLSELAYLPLQSRSLTLSSILLEFDRDLICASALEHDEIILIALTEFDS